MKSKLSRYAILLALMTAAGCATQSTKKNTRDTSLLPTPEELADVKPVQKTARGPGDAKLSLDLIMLRDEILGSRSPGQGSAVSVTKNYLVSKSDEAPSVDVAIRVRPDLDPKTLETGGVVVQGAAEDLVFARVPVAWLDKLTLEPGVMFVSGQIRTNAPPKPPKPKSGSPDDAVFRDSKPLSPGQFDKQGLTGKGVIIAVIDSGIDWKHPDFINPDGTSRILYLYDQFDNSFAESSGAIGTQGIYTDSKSKKSIGTLYTRAQINAALAGTGKCNSVDINGHGTACASTAAGNGRAAGTDVDPASIMGVAPEADLIVIKVMHDEGTQGNIFYLITRWIAETAKKEKMPVVMSMSLGGHSGPHDGTLPEERFIDNVLTQNPKGTALCVAAGNEGAYNFVANVRFGPKREGQMDNYSATIPMELKENTFLSTYFSRSDDWALTLARTDTSYLDAKGNKRYYWVNLFAKEGAIYFSVAGPKADAENARRKMIKDVDLANLKPYFAGTNEHEFIVPLQAGSYMVAAYGRSEKAPVGKASFYLPGDFNSYFGTGVSKTYMVGSPGNSTKAITVGAYTCRNTWTSLDGPTYYNLPVGQLANFSSPGFRRDDQIKPDIVGPGEYMLSALSADSNFAESSSTLPGGKYCAWPGTSAATPFAAGTIALMLEKNPNLSLEQIRTILQKTVTNEPRVTGALPNPMWGYGKLNPEAALRATPR